MPMMASQILKSVDFTKTQKSRYFKNETFFLQIKRFINCTSRASLRKRNSFLAKVMFKFLVYFVYFIFEPVFGLFKAVKIKISWNVQSVSTSAIDAFPSYKDVLNTMVQR